MNILRITAAKLLQTKSINDEETETATAKKQPRYHATLTFDREQLLYDIKNYCYVEGHVMPEGAEQARHMTKDVGEYGNIDRANRLLNLLHAETVEVLYPYSRDDVHTAAVAVPWNDTLTEVGQYRIDLLLPDKFSQTTLNLLELLIHEWWVAYVVGDWLSITYPEKAATWFAKAEQAKERIKGIKNNRIGDRARIKMHPF